MKEGRMKGQGFITFPTEEAAEKALNDTNGYVLNGKPMAAKRSKIFSKLLISVVNEKNLGEILM
jgi:RNA recognition motif-containing protein